MLQSIFFDILERGYELLFIPNPFVMESPLPAGELRICLLLRRSRGNRTAATILIVNKMRVSRSAGSVTRAARASSIEAITFTNGGISHILGTVTLEGMNEGTESFFTHLHNDMHVIWQNAK